MECTTGTRYGAKALSAAAIAFLAACGGGGGGGGPDPNASRVTPASIYTPNAPRLVEAGRRAAVSEPGFGSVFQSAGVNVAAVRSAGITRRADGSFTTEIRRADGSRTALNSVDHLFASAPVVSPAARAAEGATLLDYGAGYVTLAGGTVDHDPNDFGDWIAGGYWLHIEGDWRNGGVEGVEIGAVVDGPEISRPATVPGIGTASYRGVAGGIYGIAGGSDAAAPGASQVGDYRGAFRATADFGAGTVSGRIDGITLTGVTVHPDGRTDVFEDDPDRTVLTLVPGRIGTDGRAAGRVLIASPDFEIASQSGSWGARLSAVEDRYGVPRGIAGTHGGAARTAGGSEVVFVGVHGVPGFLAGASGGGGAGFAPRGDPLEGQDR